MREFKQVLVPIDEPLTYYTDGVEVFVICQVEDGQIYELMGGVYYTLERAKQYIQEWVDAANEDDSDTPSVIVTYKEEGDECMIANGYICSVYEGDSLAYMIYQSFLRR